MSRPWSAIKAFIREADWIQVLVPLVVLAFYFVALSGFLAWLMPADRLNVTAAFIDGTAKILLVLVAGLAVVFCGLFRIAGRDQLHFSITKEKIPVGDWLLVLLPLTPVAQYVLNNQDILSPWGSVYILAVFAAFAWLFVVAAPVLFGVVSSPRVLVFMGLAFTFTITNMASLTAYRGWLERGSLKIQLPLFGAVFLVGWLVDRLLGRRFLYFVVATFFVANGANQFLSQGQASDVAEAEVAQAQENSLADHELVKLVGSRVPVSTPSIYLLIYDAYVGNETMLSYGLDNSAHEDYLVGMGFDLYPQTYSVASFTLGTMSRTLNASTGFYGVSRTAASGDGVVQGLLKGLGYETWGIFYSDFFFQGVGSHYDRAYPSLKATHKMLTKAILMGEFRFDVEFDTPSREQFVKNKREGFEKVPNGPRFVYLHERLPGHSQNSGHCRDNEVELYDRRLEEANRAMKEDLELITEKDAGAVIIVAGDHGPFLTKNCFETADEYEMAQINRLDVQDRFGTFLAIKWPTKKFAAYDDITVLQDLFPAVFAYMFEDAGMLAAKPASKTLRDAATSGVTVLEGRIQGGIDDGEPLFLSP